MMHAVPLAFVNSTDTFYVVDVHVCVLGARAGYAVNCSKKEDSS